MTGLRLGELAALRWADIDLQARRLRVMRTAYYTGAAGVVYQPPKTPRSRRAVDLSAETAEVLADHRRRQVEQRLAAGPAWADQDIVFADPDGSPRPPYRISQAFAQAVKAAGIEGRVRFHDLRHLSATLFLEQGVHARIVAERLGHAQTATTMDTYSHVTPTMQRQASELLDPLLKRLRGKPSEASPNREIGT